MTLHDGLVAAVTERLKVARAAASVEDDVASRHGPDWNRPQVSALWPEHRAFHAANDPATVARVCEADLERLAVHSPCTTGCVLHLVPMTCHHCDAVTMRCPEILRITRVYATTTEVRGG